MAKRLGITIALLAAVLAGVYQLRTQLLTGAVNRLLRDSDLELLQLDQLQIGVDGLHIGELVVALGADRAPQLFHQVHLSYTLLQARPHQLEIAQATLQLPAGQDNAPAAVITDLLSQLFLIPLDAISIAALEIRHWTHPLVQFPLALNAELARDRVELIVLGGNLELALALQDPHAKSLQLDLSLAASGRAVTALELNLSGSGDTIQTRGNGELDLDSLAFLLAPLVPLPEPILAIDGRLPFSFNARLANTLSPDALVQGLLSIHPNSKAALTASSEMEPAGEVRIDVDLPKGAALEISTSDAGQPRTTASADLLSITLIDAQRALEFMGSLEQLSCLLPQQSCQAAVSANAHTAQLDLGNGVRLQNAVLSLQASAALSDGQLSLDLSPGELFRADELQQGELLASDPVLINEGAARLEYALDDGEMALSAGRLNLLLPRFKLPELNIATSVALSKLSLSLAPDSQTVGSARLVADGINLQHPSGWLPALAVDSDIELTGGQLSLQAQLGSGQSRELFSLTAAYALDDTRLTGSLWTNDIHFDPDSKHLSRFFASWPYPWDIMQGKLALRADFKWPGAGDKPALVAAINSSWEDLSGTYDETGFFNLDGKAAANYTSPDHLVIKKNANISLERLDIGVPVENISASFNLDSSRQQIRVPKLEARLFGGRVWTENVNYRADRDTNRIDIGVDGLQLAQLLAATGYEAIEGTGSISGLLPLNVNANGITMTQGMLAAKEPGGTFRYKAELAADSNAAMAQVSEALSNYHYTIFQTEADYLKNGDLELAMQLRGRNPDMAQARPIHLNLNLTDNIPKLLRSLQSGRTITDLVSREMGNSGQQ